MQNKNYEIHSSLLSGMFAADPACVAWATLAGLQKNNFKYPEQQVLCAQYFVEAFYELRKFNDEASQSEVAKIYRKATQIPYYIGDTIDAIFSPASLPSTFSTIAAVKAAVRLNRPVSSLLHLDPEQLQRLKTWSNHKTAGIKSAKLNFPDLKIIKIEGQWVFEIPGKRLKLYAIKNTNVAQKMVRLRIGHGMTMEDLNKIARVNSASLDKLSFSGKCLRIVPSGVLSIGPQLVLDVLNAKSFDNFLSLEAHDQTSGILSIVIGIGMGKILGRFAAKPVLLIGLATGIIVQIFLGDIRYRHLGNRTVNQWVGDHITPSKWI